MDPGGGRLSAGTRPVSGPCRRRWGRRGVLLTGLCLCLAGLLPGLAGASDVPADIRISDLDGREHRLEQMWSRRPLLLTLYYTRCPGVCTPYLMGLAETLERLGGAGDDYDVLALPFDPEDGPAQVRAHAERFGLLGRPGWIFATAEAVSLAELADSFGFWYRLDAARQQYDHPAMTAVVSGGRVVRVLEGSPVSTRALRETLWELQGHFVPTYTLPGRDSLLSCLAYDPVTGRARPNWGLLVLCLPALLAFAVVGLMFARARPGQSAPD